MIEERTEKEILKTSGRLPVFTRLFVTVVLIIIVTELIGIHKIPLGPGAILFLPMLYAVVIGILITPDVLGKPIAALRKLIGKEEIELAGPMVMLTLLPLGTKLGTLIGPKIMKIVEAGPAFFLQELGNLGTIFLALPIALALGLKREAVGATVSICREPTLGVIAEKYGINSPEGTGTLGTFLTGTILGTIFYGILASFSVFTGLHPYALAMGCGIGSASMMTASSGALSMAVDSAMKDTVLAYAAISQLLTSVTGMYSVIFIALPLNNFLYNKLIPFFSRNKSGKEVSHV